MVKIIDSAKEEKSPEHKKLVEIVQKEIDGKELKIEEFGERHIWLIDKHALKDVKRFDHLLKFFEKDLIMSIYSSDTYSVLHLNRNDYTDLAMKIAKSYERCFHKEIEIKYDSSKDK